MANVIWTPQPRQAALMAHFEDEALYGGTAGGGKSDYALAEALRQVGIPHYRGLILHRIFPQLMELMDRSTEIYRRAYKEARLNKSEHVWTFLSGAKTFFGSMQYAKDRTNYQGERYGFIDFGELIQFLWEEYNYLFSRNRPSGPGTRCYIRTQADPGGVGHGWVKERFITAAQPMQMIWEQFKIRFPDGHKKTHQRSRIFVPFSVLNDRILLVSDPDYLTSLAFMPEQERKALLYGDWDTFAGQVFTGWRNGSDHYMDRTNTHVISPFKVPWNWAIWRGLNWGCSRSFFVGRYAVDRDRRLYRIREYYDHTGTSNADMKMEPSEVVQEVWRTEIEDLNLKDRRINRVEDLAIQGSNGTESIGALMEQQRVYLERGDHARTDGKMQMHHRLVSDEGGILILYVLNTCKYFIRTVPNLIYDGKNVEDINTEDGDHVYGELRYVYMKNPIASRRDKPPSLAVYDLLDLG